ncbi:hypothetical protein FJT64_026244 [Amphibalanus amphitrite]|uniref:Uncharacterized protein n=1 Tax=Amphibalanus amphitrite TaxID=1232801 RepID=A0A6A4WCS4_AMPAM|nr:hypothetical protein FJT64_026244 [Amphibalanus amphitrite]KAF0301451.1 hypothetical protein FJT64_026244 [Amphibalanus amphitrite]
MSQYGGNKSAPPPWAQTPGMLQRPAPQPLGQQALLQQPGLTPAMLMQQQIQQPAQPVMTVGSGGVAYPTGRNLGPTAGGAYPGQQLLQVGGNAVHKTQSVT